MFTFYSLAYRSAFSLPQSRVFPARSIAISCHKQHDPGTEKTLDDCYWDGDGGVLKLHSLPHWALTAVPTRAPRKTRVLSGSLGETQARAPLGSVVSRPPRPGGWRAPGSACAGALPALPGRCGHCPAAARLRPLWAAPSASELQSTKPAAGAEPRPEPRVGPRPRSPEPQQAVIPSARVGRPLPRAWRACARPRPPSCGWDWAWPEEGVRPAASLSFLGGRPRRGPRASPPLYSGAVAGGRRRAGRGAVGGHSRLSGPSSLSPDPVPGSPARRRRDGPEASDGQAPGEQPLAIPGCIWSGHCSPLERVPFPALSPLRSPLALRNQGIQSSAERASPKGGCIVGRRGPGRRGLVGGVESGWFGECQC